MKRQLLAALVLFGLVGADAPKQGNLDGDLEKLQGTWKYTTMQVQGKDLPLQNFNQARMVVKNDRFTMTSLNITYKGTFKLDATATPKTLDIAFTEGPEKGQTARAIYDVDGDTWKLCLGLAGKERPHEFATTPNSGHVLETLKRMK